MNIMLKKLVLIATICCASYGFQLNSCQTQQDDRMIEMGPDVHADLVCFFKKGTTADQILEFHRTVIGIPDSNGSGHSFLPGMVSVVRVVINGFDGEAINFQPDATAEQKTFVKKRVLDSPLIYKIYENVVPNEIKDL
jgi:hypothetical protein